MIDRGFTGPNQWVQMPPVIAFVRQRIQRVPAGRVIVYGSTKTHVGIMAEQLGCEAFDSGQDDQAGIIARFRQGPTGVIVATSALGMGVDLALTRPAGPRSGTSTRPSEGQVPTSPTRTRTRTLQGSLEGHPRRVRPTLKCIIFPRLSYFRRTKLMIQLIKILLFTTVLVSISILPESYTNNYEI